jgi:hypothetical protein
VFVAYPGQRVPEAHPGSRGCNVPINSTLAADLRGAAMAGDVLRMERLLNGLSRSDRAKIANAGGLQDYAAGDSALHLAVWKGQLAAVSFFVCGRGAWQ